MRNGFLFGCLFIFGAFFSQNVPLGYNNYVAKGDSLFRLKKYSKAILNYSHAIKLNEGKANPYDRLNLACAWNSIHRSDSAFFHLQRISINPSFTDFELIESRSELTTLHKDKRWAPIIRRIKENKNKREANFNRPLIAQLEKIFDEDQKCRAKVEFYEKNYGVEYWETQKLWDTILQKDAINIKEVTKIIDRYGWLGADVVGEQGNATLFLVIQHADLNIQEKYLPIMRKAAKDGKAQWSDLAMLEDRVAVRHGKKQIYGTQSRMDKKGNYTILPIEDEQHVNQRRKSVGLEPIEEYAKEFGIKYQFGSSDKDRIDKKNELDSASSEVLPHDKKNWNFDYVWLPISVGIIFLGGLYIYLRKRMKSEKNREK